MKFLAVLKDSYRDAVDGKIFQIMLIAAVLMAFVVASVSFKPSTPKDDFEQFTGMMNGMLSLNPMYKDSKMLVENYRQTNDAPEPWRGDYQFDYVISTPSAEALENYRKSGIPTSRFMVQQLIRQRCFYLDNLKVEEVPKTHPGEVRFRVTSQGTKVTDVNGWPHSEKIFFAMPLNWLNVFFRDSTLHQYVYRIEKTIITDIGAWVAVLLSIVISAGFIPNLLQKGTIDLLLSKPLGRTELLVYRYCGGLVFIALLTAGTVFPMWIVIGLRAGVWAPQFLTLIPAVTGYFAILYSVSVLVGVLTRSTVLAILATVVVWAFAFGIGFANDKIDEAKLVQAEVSRELQKSSGRKVEEIEDLDPTAGDLGWPPGIVQTIRVLHAASPRTFDLDRRVGKLIAESILNEAELKEKGFHTTPVRPWWEIIGVSAVFIAVMLGLASWRFAVRDF